MCEPASTVCAGQWGLAALMLAPQSILLAVPFELESPWTIWSLQQVLLETLDLARIRAVDLSTLNEVGHYLPALYFAYNLLGDAVSTDFTTIE